MIEEGVDIKFGGTFPSVDRPLHPGSYAAIYLGDALKSLKSFTVVATLWPTTPDKENQGVISCIDSSNDWAFNLCIESHSFFSYTLPHDLKSGVYAARLRCGETEDAVPFFVCPPKGKPATKLCVLVSTFTNTIYGNMARPDFQPSWLDRIQDWKAYPWNPEFINSMDFLLIIFIQTAAAFTMPLTNARSSPQTLDALKQYREQGGNYMYLGGNGFYWRVALHPEEQSTIEIRRAEGGIRAWAAEPGEYYHAFDGAYGGLWRRNNRPPQQLLDVGFSAQGTFQGS